MNSDATLCEVPTEPGYYWILYRCQWREEPRLEVIHVVKGQRTAQLLVEDGYVPVAQYVRRKQITMCEGPIHPEKLRLPEL